MRVEVVYHHADSLGLWVEIVYEVAHHCGELRLSAALGRPHLSSALEGFEGHEHVGRSPALILGVDALWLAGLGGKRLSHLGQQLAGPLVKAHHLLLRIVGLLVEVQHLLHPPHEGSVLLGRDHPLLDQVRLEFIF
jgi:hypothetical protein